MEFISDVRRLCVDAGQVGISESNLWKRTIPIISSGKADIFLVVCILMAIHVTSLGTVSDITCREAYNLHDLTVDDTAVETVQDSWGGWVDTANDISCLTSLGFAPQSLLDYWKVHLAASYYGEPTGLRMLGIRELTQRQQLCSSVSLLPYSYH